MCNLEASNTTFIKDFQRLRYSKALVSASASAKAVAYSLNSASVMLAEHRYMMRKILILSTGLPHSVSLMI